jgi:hypothetical protein
MTTVSVIEGNLVVETEGWDKLWALRSRLAIPINHVARVYADSTIAQSWLKGLKLAGADIPGVLSAGTFYHHGKWVFWDVHNPENVIVIDLHDERYEKLIVEVTDPADTMTRVQAALPKV